MRTIEQVCYYVRVSKTVYNTTFMYYRQFFYYYRGGKVKIVRVLNTNAVVTVDQKGREVIATGAGIGFKKRKGENLDQSLVDKTYYLQNSEDSHRLQEVVQEISEQYLEIAGRVVEAARAENLQIRDALYITLTDHINSALERHHAGIHLKNMMKLEIKKFYPKEYKVGCSAIEWIREKSGVDLGEDEAAFVAMHIVSAEFESGQDCNVEQITEMLNSILQILKLHLKIEFREDSFSYQRFLTHLKFFAMRVLDQSSYQDSMQEIYKVMVEQNRRAYSGVIKVGQYIEKRFGHRLSIDEQLYLLIHIKRILDEQEQTE